jgi:hypothetical protein
MMKILKECTIISSGEGDYGPVVCRTVESNFGREQRIPFAGGGVVVRRAADEFMSAILVSDEARRAEGGDELTACGKEKTKT